MRLRASAGLCALVVLQAPLPRVARADDAAAPPPGAAGCRRGGDAALVVAFCSEIIATSKNTRALERAYNLRGLAHEAAGEFQAAADDAGEVIRRDPKVAGFFDNRARAYRGLGRPDLALRDADAAVRMAPGYAFVFHGRGGVYADLGRYDLAARDLSAAVALDPADPSLLVDRGRALASLDRPDEAVADFTAALAIRPDDEAALRERGLIRRRLGAEDDARTDLQAALALAPEDAAAAEALRQTDAPAPAAPARPEAGQAAQLTPNQQFEEESKRRLQRDQEDAATRARVEATIRAEQLSRAVVEARRSLKEAAEFVAANRDDPTLEDHLRRIQRLRAAAEGADPASIASETQSLRAGLAADPVYAAYRGPAEARRQAAERQTLDDALRTLGRQRTFLIDAAARDALSPAAGEFMALAGQVPGLQASPDLGRAETLVGRIDAAIDRAGLTQSYALFRKAPGGDAGSGAAERGKGDGVPPDAPAR